MAQARRARHPEAGGPGLNGPYDQVVVAEIEPPELAALLDTAERPRASNWSLRAALTRYAQPQPQRASDVVELLRRVEAALKPFAKVLEREGEAVWNAVATGGGDVDPTLLGLLHAVGELDRLGDQLATWAVDHAGERPDGDVDAVVAEVGVRLERLGVRHEERPRPTGTRGGRGV